MRAPAHPPTKELWDTTKPMILAEFKARRRSEFVAPGCISARGSRPGRRFEAWLAVAGRLTLRGEGKGGSSRWLKNVLFIAAVVVLGFFWKQENPDRTVCQLHETAQQAYDIDVRRLLYMAAKCHATTDGKRFLFPNHRLAPLSVHGVNGGWSIHWQADDGMSWTGPVDDPLDCNIDDWGLPLRAQQSFRPRWRHSTTAPTVHQITPLATGELRVLRHGHLLVRMKAISLPRFRSDVDHKGRSEAPDSARTLSHAMFIRIDDGFYGDGVDSERGAADLEPVNHDVCQDCAGTGFCRDCLGEADRADRGGQEESLPCMC